MEYDNKDIDYIANSKGDRLYINPAIKNGVQYGAFAKLIDDNEKIIGITEVGDRFKIGISVFYSTEFNDFTTFKITKNKYHKRFGWKLDGEVKVNGFQLANLRQFTEILSSLKLSEASKTKIDLQEIGETTFNTILNSETGKKLIQTLSENPELTTDIFALANKKFALNEFKQLLDKFEEYKDSYIQKYGIKSLGE